MFEGSIGRISFLVQYVCLLLVAIGAAELVTHVSEFFGLFVFIFGFFLTAYAFSLLIRRLHDISLSGWFSLLLFIPGIGLLLVLGLAVWPGQSSIANRAAPSS